jgi:hypothetical protein
MSISIFLVSMLFNLAEGGFRELKTALFCGILMGLLPMVSAHAYIGVGEYAIFLCLLSFPYLQQSRWMRTILAWGIFGSVAILLSLPQVLWLMRVKRPHFLRYHPIYWDFDPVKVIRVVRVWWRSLASFGAISLVFVFFVNDSRQNRMYAPAMGVWIVSNLIRYQPAAMDNTKVFFSGWYALACAAAANYVVVVWNQRNRIARCALVLAMLGASTGGLVAIFKAFWGYALYSGDERDIGIWTMENTRKDAAILVGGWHSNTMLAIAGRLITMGYVGWVGTHGLSLDDRKAFMSQLVEDRENVSLFAPLNIVYAIEKTDEKHRFFTFGPPGPGSRWMLIHELGHLRIYRGLTTL